MSIKRITLATALLFTLTACGSSGGSSANSHQTPATPALTPAQIQTQLQTEISQLKQKVDTLQQNVEQAKAASTLSEKEKTALNQELAEVKQNLNALLEERNKQQAYTALVIELTQAAKDKGLSEWEASSFAYQNAEKGREAALAALDKQLEVKQLAIELTDIAKEKGLADWEASNFANENAEKGKEAALVALDTLLADKALVAELTQLAKDKGLTEWEASNFVSENAKNGKEAALVALDKLAAEKLQSKINSVKAYYGSTPIVDLPQGFTPRYEYTEKTVYDNNGKALAEKEPSYKDVYNQQYSLITANYKNEYSAYSNHFNEQYSVNVNGYNENAVMPTTGSANYHGVAFNKNGQGNLSYTIDFTNKQGSGVITGLPEGELVLEKADLYKAFDREWKATGEITAKEWADQAVTGSYSATLFGSNMEEIGGIATLKQETEYQYDANGTSQRVAKGTKALDKINDYTYDKIEMNIGFGGSRGEVK